MTEVDDNKIWLSEPQLGGREDVFIKQAFDKKCLGGFGANLDGFEEDLEKYNNINSVVALNSGTSAIHLALILLGVKEGDEVLCSSFTFCATVNPICYLGATPILIDSEIDTWNCDPIFLEEAIIDRIAKGNKPKALVLVHLYGMPAKMEEILSVCNKYNIPLIEDAAEALGSTYRGKKLGSIGEFGVVSFNGNKIITTSGGGALMSENAEKIAKAKFLSTQAQDNAPYYQHSQIGYNYRMNNVSAGIGRGQMEVLAEYIEKRRANYEYYRKHLSCYSGVKFIDEPEGCFSNRWLTCLLFVQKGLNKKVRSKLMEHNIESRYLWKPMHLQPVFSEMSFYGNGISEYLFEYGLCLPSGSDLSGNQLRRIVEVIISVIK